MTDKPIIIIYKESLAQSVISDIVTFGFILICVWSSWASGSRWWTFFTATVMLFFIVVQLQKFTASDNRLRFYSIEQVEKWVVEQKKEDSK